MLACVATDPMTDDGRVDGKRARAVSLAWDVVLDHEAGRAIAGRVDALLGFLLAAFALAPVDPADIRAALAGEVDTDLDDHGLALIADGAVPVAVMRELLHRHRIVFDPARVPHWNAFVERYGASILSI